MQSMTQFASPVGRFLLALIFVVAGAGKITSYAGTQGYMESMGVPGALLPAVIALELLGGLAIIVGWQTRVIAFLLAGFSIVSAIIFHAEISDSMQQIMFLKNLGLAGGMLILVAQGPGAYALDNRKGAS